MANTIYSLARSNIVDTWDLLEGKANYGETLLQSKVDIAKYRLFGTVVSATIESTIYNPLEMNYAAKMTALDVIPTAIDYYKNQRITIQTTGTTEAVSYPDRIRALEKLYATFTQEAMKLALELPDLQKRSRRALPRGNTKPLVTQDPSDFPVKQSPKDPFHGVQGGDVIV